MQVVCAGSAGADDVATHERMRGPQLIHRVGHPGAVFVGVSHDHEVALVTHHPAHRETPGTGEVGDASGIGREASASGESHVHVDEHLAQSGGRGRVDGLGGVHRDRDSCTILRRCHGAQARRVEHLVGKEEIVAKIGRGHAHHLARRRARERAVACAVLRGGERRALVRLHVRSQPSARVDGGHRRQVLFEQVGVDHQGGCRQIEHVHRRRVSRTVTPWWAWGAWRAWR